MKHPKVVSRTNLPTDLPLTSSVAVWLLLDRLKPPGWVWGIVGTLFAMVWIGAITSICIQDDVKLKELS